MKKSFIVLCISISLFALNFFIEFDHLSEINSDRLTTQIKTESVSLKEEVYEEIILTTLHPYILRDIGSYYEKTLKYPPSVSPYITKVFNIEKPDRMNPFKFLITIRVRPYVGTHNKVGEDELTYSLDWGEINLENYEHIKDYKLPSYLEHLYRGSVTEIAYKDGYRSVVVFEVPIKEYVVHPFRMLPKLTGEWNEPVGILGNVHHLEINALVDKYSNYSRIEEWNFYTLFFTIQKLV